MRTCTVGIFKSQFSEILDEVLHGHEIAISYGKKKETVAVLIPFKQYKKKKRKLGLLKNKARFTIKSDFKISEQDLISE